jgi:hypothetical protein
MWKACGVAIQVCALDNAKSRMTAHRPTHPSLHQDGHFTPFCSFVAMFYVSNL